MTAPYLHPVSLISAALLITATLLLRRRSAAEQTMPFFSLGCGGMFAVLLAVPAVFGVASAYTDPGREGFINVLFAQVTTLPLYLAALVVSDGSLARREQVARTLDRYRPARLTREGVTATAGRPRTWITALLLCTLTCAVFGVRFGEHLRARTLVSAQPADVGPVTVLNTEGAQVGQIPSRGLLRPGEIVCPSITVHFTAPDGTVLPLQIETNSNTPLLPSSTGNIIENAWVCDEYAAHPPSAPLPDSLRATWQQTRE